MSSNKLDKKQDVYDVEIDRYIVNILKDNSSIGHGELKRGSEQELKRKISPVTFSKHLSRLVSKGLLKKEEHGIGKKTDYLLTEMALKKISLGLLGNSQEKIDLFKRIYSTIFFFDVYRLPKVTTSEYEFEKLLARFKLNKNDLNWNRIIFAENSEAADLAYGVGSDHTFFNRYYWDAYFKFWENRDGIIPILKEIKFVCYPKPKYGIDFEIQRIDYLQFNSRFPIYNYLKEYYLCMPGFSNNDILSIHPDLNSDVLLDGLNRLEKLGLIKELPALNEDRFRISDDSLRNLLGAAWTIHRDGEFDRLIDKWSFFEQPTEDEVRRMKILLGNDEAKRIFRMVDLKRSKFNVFRRKCKSAKDLHDYIIWEWTPKVATPAIPAVSNRSSMPDGEGLKFLYRISHDFQDIVFAQRLDRFRRMKENGKIVHKKGTKNEAQEYFEYLGDGLYRELRYLFSADDNIEDIKIALSDTIINYAFLEDIIRDICPKILEPIDEDVQKEIEENELQSIMRANITDLIYIIKQEVNGNMTLREIRDMAEIHECQASLKSGTIFDYDIQKTFNSFTQRLEHRKIFHLLNRKELQSGRFSLVQIIEKAYNPITQRMEELPVIHYLDTNRTHIKRTTKKKSKNRDK